MYLTVNRYRPGNQRRIIGITGIQPLAVDIDAATIHIKPFQLAVIHLCLTRGQCGTIGVNKTAATAGDAGRIGNHHLSTSAGNFDEPVQLAGVTAVDLVKDDAGLLFRQPGLPATIPAS